MRQLAVALFGILTLTLPFAAKSQVLISEFVADNKNSLLDEDAQSSDWIELYNTNSASINLGGWALTDDPAHTARWVFPSTNLAARGFLVVFASGKNRALPGRPLHTDFSLRAAGEYLALLKPDGSVAHEFAPETPEQYPDISYGIAQEVRTNVLFTSGATARYVVPKDSTLGATWTGRTFNDAAWNSGATGIGYETAVPGFAVYTYVANVGVCSMDAAYAVIGNPAQQLAVFSANTPVVNFVNTGSGEHYGNDMTFPGLVMGQDRDNFVVQATATITIPSAGQWTFGVNSDDGFTLNIGGQVMSYPNPRGPSDTLQTFNFAQAGSYPLTLVFYECGGGSELELFAAKGSYGSWDSTNFKLVGAPDGLAVTAPVVTGGSSTGLRPFIKTDVQNAMSGVNPTAYLRVKFTVAAPAAYQSLTLRMMYDDGFVAYLNGQEVARRNAPAMPGWNSTATAARSPALATQFEEINISDRLSSLVAGDNVLAIQGLNVTSSDPDFLILPELIEYQSTNTAFRYFSKPTPGGLNSSGFVAFVADTKFSVDRGFFETAFSLSITSATAGATIIYTTNGTPPTLSSGYTYKGPLTIGGTTVLRAAAFKEGYQPSDVDTQTYLFLNDIIRQSPTGAAPPGWPASWGANVVDYGMDPDIVNSATYQSQVIPALKSLPSFSIVTDLKNLFDPGTGIYANPGQDGIAWERPISLELIYPDGTEGFQANAGIRIRGGYSRSTGNPKHAFRLFFRQEYGTSKLDYPVFAKQNGAETFDSFDLRTFQNYSWSFEGDYRFIGLRDQWSRDTQYTMGHPAERGDFYHLYINGQYWGVFNSAERPEADYGASYFGGKDEDYDTIKVDDGYITAATDGNMDAWSRLWRAATNGFASDADYLRIQGLNVDGTPNPAYENLLDVENLIDYMLLVFFTGNVDAPISQFLGNNSPNNFYAVRHRQGLSGGFKFFSHDGEHTLHHETTLGGGELNRDRTMPMPAGDPISQGAATAFAKSNPQYIFTRLSTNAEFRLRVADKVQKHFYNGGVFTTEAARARLLTRSNEIYQAVVTESARWGDSKRHPPRTRDVDWVTEMNRVYGSYLGQRPGIVLNQLRTRNLFPSVGAPSFNRYGGNIDAGFQLTMSAATGTIYYTTDGSDPRLRGGAVSTKASVYSGPLTLNNSAIVKARVRSGTTWSALSEATFFVLQNFTELMVTEIMYNPPGASTNSGDRFEFIELKNVGTAPLELSGIQFTNGISYAFPVGSFLEPGRFAVLVADAQAFASRYPGVPIAGVFTNKLSNSGEKLTLVHVSGVPLYSAAYGTRAPWPELADGAGFSIVPVNPNLNPDPANPLNWRASAVIGGSPGADDAPSNIPRIVVNEVLTHTDLPQVDWVELHNPYPTNVSVAGWYLTDDRGTPMKYRIPPGKTIPANGYLVLYENEWNSGQPPDNQFRFSSHGDEVYLYSGDAAGALTGYSDGFAFGAAQNGVTFGRYTNSVHDIQYPAQAMATPGAVNAGPRVGPIVINEINYNPPAGGDEFLELKNVSSGSVQLFHPAFPTNRWRLNGVGFDFPAAAQVPANGLVLLVGIDPAQFRAKYGVAAEVQIFGPYPGVLQDSGENLSLQMPDAPDLDTNTGFVLVPYIDVDVVRYNDKAPWPTNADGYGSSLERLKANLYGNDPANWRDSMGYPSPGLENGGNRRPMVSAGPDLSIDATNYPFALPLTGSVADDGLPNGVTTASWTQVSGPASAWFDDPQKPATTVRFPGSGTYVLRLTGSDGEFSTSDEVDIVVNRPNTPAPVNLVVPGATWKYLDKGSDQGTAWTALSFNDSAWAAGPSPLGYSDANGVLPATTVSYGPDANNKYITTYFRHTFSVADPAALRSLTVSVQMDDGAIVYLNRTPILTNNMPQTAIGYQTTAVSAVGGATETMWFTAEVPPALLVKGANVIAAEIHQANATSSDLFFNLSLFGETLAPNRGPAVYAGSDLSVTLPGLAALEGYIMDDGLPVPPGLLTFGWAKLSGPGTVTFGNAASLKTTAVFSAAGDYVLRLSGSDGALAATDDIAITVTGQSVPDPVTIELMEYVPLPTPSFRVGFAAAAAQRYEVQFSSSPAGSAWQKLADVPAGEARTVVVTDPGAGGAQARYYRVLAPTQ